MASFLLALCQQALAQIDNDVDALNQQVQNLIIQHKFREAMPIATEAVNDSEALAAPDQVKLALSLIDLAVLDQDVGDYSNSVPLLQRALEIYDKNLGPDDPQIATILNVLAVSYHKIGDYTNAEPLLIRALAIREKALGPYQLGTAQDFNNLATLYESMGEYSKAEPFSIQALNIRQKALGPEHPDTATSLDDLAAICGHMGEYAKAELLFKLALNIREKALGPEHPETARCVNNLASLYVDMGDYAKAESFFQRALNIREKALGPEHPDTGNSLQDLAAVYCDIGDYAKAEPLIQRALSIDEKVLGPDHPKTAEALGGLAMLYEQKGEYAKAEPLYQRALNIDEKTLGPEHPGTATCLSNLGHLYYQMGDYTKAEPLFQRALNIRVKALGPENPLTAASLNNLAEPYEEKGEYAKAEPLLQRALNIDEKTLGPEHPDTAAGLNNLAALYAKMGEFAKAEPLYQRALNIFEKAQGPKQPETASALNNLAGLYRDMGEYAKAEPLLQRALNIFEKAKGPEHPETANSVNDLAKCYEDMGDYAKAESFYQRALNIRLKALGPENPMTADNLDNLAQLYERMGDYTKAEPLLERALSIYEKALGPEHPKTANVVNDLAEFYEYMGDYAKAESLYQRALSIDEKVLGQENAETAVILDNISSLFIGEGKRSEAAQMDSLAQQTHLKNLADILSFASEQQRLDFMAHFNPYSLLASMENGPDTALAILRCKGVVLDSLVEDRIVAQASVNPEDRDLIDQLISAKQRAYRLTLGAPKDLSEAGLQRHAAEREGAQSEVDRLEGDLGRHVASLGRTRRALSVTVAEVQSVIPNQAVLVEFLCYNHYLGPNKSEVRYGAAVLASDGEPRWVNLGAAKNIDINLQRYQKLVRQGLDDPDETALKNCLQALYRQLWQPVEQVLTPAPLVTTTVILCPDSRLNFVSFATLLSPDNRFLGEEYSLRYVASGRDLLREIKPGLDSRMVVFANPDFSGTKTVISTNQVVDNPGQFAMRGVERGDLQDLYLPPLPGTATESAALVAQAKTWNWPTEVYLEGAATKAQLDEVRSPHILHLATHGFFLPGSEEDEGDQAGGLRGIAITSSFQPSSGLDLLAESGGRSERHVILKNPMYRSGLALAGAQATLDAWKRGEVPPTENDGIVTAEEVGALKLDGTWLVTLSACDTGIGQALSGEGVMGLRRGFIQAGAENLLMTLWPVADEETARFMVDFYSAAQKSGNAPKALAEVQRDWLVKLRGDRGLAEAVRIAGPFIMNSQGSVK